jgi:hypothetical protein
MMKHISTRVGSLFPLCQPNHQLPPAFLSTTGKTVNCSRCLELVKQLPKEEETVFDRQVRFFFGGE